MGHKAAVGLLSAAVLLTRAHPALQSNERSEECRFPQPTPIHWIRPLAAVRGSSWDGLRDIVEVELCCGSVRPDPEQGAMARRTDEGDAGN